MKRKHFKLLLKEAVVNSGYEKQTAIASSSFIYSFTCLPPGK